MKNLKLELFNFKKNLKLEQLDISRIAQIHLENYDNMSEKEYSKSLRESLKPFFYDKDIKLFVENTENEISSNSLVYDLKDLFKRVERKNLGMLYRQPLVALLEIINQPDDDSRMEKILNELNLYDWVPEIKKFLFDLTNDPIERQNYKNSGKAEKIYTLVEKVVEGHLAFVIDRWFLIAENEIKQVIADDYIKEDDKRRNIRMLEQVLQLSEISDDKIIFKIDENLTISLSTKDKSLYLNDEKLDKESTLESIFSSTIVPYLKRDYFNLISTAANNIDKFVELDIALKVNNLLNNFTESIVFNYKDKNYVYSIDSRIGSRFYAYENVTELIHDIQKELDYDLTPFFENKMSDEVKKLRTLTDKEKKINLKIEEIDESLNALKDTGNLFNESKELQEAFNNLIVYRDKLSKELFSIKEELTQNRKHLLK